MKHAAVTLGSGNLRLAVMLPEGEDVNEWVAVNSKFKQMSYAYHELQSVDGHMALFNIVN